MHEACLAYSKGSTNINYCCGCHSVPNCRAWHLVRGGSGASNTVCPLQTHRAQPEPIPAPSRAEARGGSLSLQSPPSPPPFQLPQGQHGLD